MVKNWFDRVSKYTGAINFGFIILLYGIYYSFFAGSYAQDYKNNINRIYDLEEARKKDVIRQEKLIEENTKVAIDSAKVYVRLDNIDSKLSELKSDTARGITELKSDLREHMNTKESKTRSGLASE